LRVLHVIRGMANSSGTTHIVGPLAAAQARLDCDVSIFCVEKGEEPNVLPDRELVASRCFRQTLRLNNPGISLDLAAALRRGIRQFDIVHVHAIWNFPSWWAMRAARKARVPYLVAPQGSLDPWALKQNRAGKKLYGTFTEIPLLRRASCIQALTAKEVRQVRAYGITAPIEIIPNGIDENLLTRERRPDPACFRLPDHCSTLLFLSRIHPKKGLELLVDVAERVRGDVPELRIVVAGGDAGSKYLDTIKAQCREKGLGDRFVFLGELKGEDKHAVLSAADAFILPSYSEGLPVAVLEALGSGLPVVITDECNLPEVRERRAGFVVPPDAPGIADAVRKLFSLSSLERAAMGTAARKLAAEKFTWDRIAGQTLDCYRRIIDGRLAR